MPQHDEELPGNRWQQAQSWLHQPLPQCPPSYVSPLSYSAHLGQLRVSCTVCVAIDSLWSMSLADKLSFDIKTSPESISNLQFCQDKIYDAELIYTLLIEACIEPQNSLFRGGVCVFVCVRVGVGGCFFMMRKQFCSCNISSQ